MKTTIASILLVLIQLSGPSRAQSTDDVARQLAGMWRLVSNPTQLADGTTRQGSSVGYAFFDATGRHMCFLTMNPDRPAWKSETAPTPEEGLAALRGHQRLLRNLRDSCEGGFYGPALRHQSKSQRGWQSHPAVVFI